MKNESKETPQKRHRNMLKAYMENGERVVEIDDLSFLYDRDHFTWLGRELRHFRHRRNLRRADRVIALNSRAALDAHKYYRVDNDKIVVKTK